MLTGPWWCWLAQLVLLQWVVLLLFLQLLVLQVD
jgi:hypothetical protein